MWEMPDAGKDRFDPRPNRRRTTNSISASRDRCHSKTTPVARNGSARASGHQVDLPRPVGNPRQYADGDSCHFSWTLNTHGPSTRNPRLTAADGEEKSPRCRSNSYPSAPSPGHVARDPGAPAFRAASRASARTPAPSARRRRIPAGREPSRTRGSSGERSLPSAPGAISSPWPIAAADFLPLTSALPSMSVAGIGDPTPRSVRFSSSGDSPIHTQPASLYARFAHVGIRGDKGTMSAHVPRRARVHLSRGHCTGLNASRSASRGVTRGGSLA